ncbi:MAG TPA: TIGR00300 family protein [Candidatus Baltobacteraceae bacterium]|nr:TIGR00300 family protein [Candidatus Baltobacteraceae bacterium]
MADPAKSEPAACVREIELRGHILDSGVFGRVLEMIMDNEHARYTIGNFAVGQTASEPSIARLRIEADNAEHLEDLLDKLRDIGAIVPDDSDVTTEPAPRDGVLPDDFYATTNLQSEVCIDARWIPVADPEMDCAIVVRGQSARTVAPSDVKAGEAVVVGHSGVRVEALQRPRRKALFEFMSSAVSSEKPKESLLAEVARELIATRAAGRRVLVVGGPAIVHTGAGKYLEWLIRDGFVDALFAGNALAAHDIEAQFFGTSLGVDLDDAFPVEEGHVHHLRAINRIRAAGGIAPAIESGLLRAGIMYEAYRRKIPVVLAGSIRDDGPLPDVITDVVEAQRAMRRIVPEIGMALCVSTLLHSIAVGNLLPASCKVICVDINPASVTKLTDRGSTQTIGLVMDAASFLREIWHAVAVAAAAAQ